MQGVHLGATVGVGMGVGIDARGVVLGAVPSVVVVGRDDCVGVDWIVDDKMQGVHLRATVGIWMGVGVLARLGVGGAIPSEGLAGRVSHGEMLRVQDAKMEDGDAVAAL